MYKYTFRCITHTGIHVRNVTVSASNYWSAKRKASMDAPFYDKYELVY